MKQYNWEKFTVLVAEDYEPSYQFIYEFLALTKINILWAKDGHEAIDLSKKNKIDIILMDIKMPKLYGHNALMEIKKQLGKIPAIATTAYATKEYEKMCYESGFDNYISKPIDINKLFKVMSEYLN